MAFVKKRSNGKYELVEKVGRKTLSIAQMGKHATVEEALAFQRKEARAPRRKGETLIGAETRRFKARRLIETFEIHLLRNMPMTKAEVTLALKALAELLVPLKLPKIKPVVGYAEKGRRLEEIKRLQQKFAKTPKPAWNVS